MSKFYKLRGWRNGSAVSERTTEIPKLVHSTHVRQVKTSCNSSFREAKCPFPSSMGTAFNMYKPVSDTYNFFKILQSNLLNLKQEKQRKKKTCHGTHLLAQK